MNQTDVQPSEEEGLGTILVVEDEYVIAQDMAVQLERVGARVLGPVGRLDAALAMLAREPEVDGAVLDIKLHDQKVYTLAEALERPPVRRAVDGVLAGEAQQRGQHVGEGDVVGERQVEAPPCS